MKTRIPGELHAPPKGPPHHRETVHLPKSERDEFTVPTPGEAGWLADFRRQLAARSPRFRSCFSEAERPGALRWKATLDLARGTLTAPRFEALGDSPTPTTVQEECLTRVLTSPPFAFPAVAPSAGQASIPVNIEHVLEF